MHPRVSVLPLAAIVVALAVSGCGGEASSSSSGSPSIPNHTESPAQTVAAIAAMEARGELPTLDVSATLGGADINHNGVRDDIDAYIAAQPDTGPQKAALLQFSKALQAVLLLDTSKAADLAAAATNVRRGVTCLWSTYQGIAAHDKVARIQQLTVDTMTRLIAYEKFNTAMDGSVVKADTGASCD